MPAARTRRLTSAAVLLVAALLPSAGIAVEATSESFRLIGSAPASTSAVASSPVYRVYLVGGSGQPVGISASPNHSVVAGGTSNQLPTERIFRDGLES